MRVAIILAFMILAVGKAEATEERRLLLNVIAEEPARGDNRLQQKLTAALTRSSRLRVQQVSETANEPKFPADYLDLDSLVNYGLEKGVRYLMMVKINSRRLERNKTFNVPFLFHRYRSQGVIEGELRFVDVERARLMVAEPFRIRLEGAAKLQTMVDDNSYDPDLLLSAYDKKVFLDALESKLAEHLLERVQLLTNGR